MIDLHVHTTNSAGRLKVEEILEMAKKQEFYLIPIIRLKKSSFLIYC